MGHRIRQPSPRLRFVLRRDSDGKVWAGPYRWTGAVFTSTESLWWATATATAMQARVNDEGFGGVTIVKLPR
jgi:hypothetical protein